MASSEFVLELDNTRDIEVLFRALTDKDTRADIAGKTGLPRGAEDIIRMPDDANRW